MRYVSLKNTSLTYFTTKGEISELSGSSKYNVWETEVQLKEKNSKPKIESTSGITDFIKSIQDLEQQHLVIKRMRKNFETLLDICIDAAFNPIPERDHLELLSKALKSIDYCTERGFVSLQHKKSLLQDEKTPYYRQPRKAITERKINKTKVKGKMYALFNLRCSRRFMAFYSISFPIGTSDNQAFICWNYWLTQLRKRFNLENYIWVTEKQKNGTIHFHMLTNNYMPILQINRVMAIIINSQVEKGLQTWGSSSIDSYNGVDVDSIFNSKRHKKTGKNLNPSELRNWITKYVTKYVSKNNETFEHLCWHCSRSISILFTSTIYEISEAWRVTNHLPSIRKMYMNYKSAFNDVWVFCFVPVDKLFDKIKYYNDLIFQDFEPKRITIKNNINYKTTTL